MNKQMVFDFELCGVLLKYLLLREPVKESSMINSIQKIGHISPGIIMSLCGLHSKCVNEHH